MTRAIDPKRPNPREGDRVVVTLNGSQLTRVFERGQWWIVRVESAGGPPKQHTQTARDERKALRHDLKAGTILYAASGYDQTNIDFYEVVMVISPKTVEVREIEQVSQESAPKHWTAYA